MIGVYSYTVILTYLSIICAGIGMMFAFNQRFTLAIIMLIACGLLDLFDGPVARTKKNRTEDEKAFGIQIDSFCDLVSFGVFPAVIGFSLNPVFSWDKIIVVFFPLFGLIRLAFFNVQEAKRQQETEEKRKFYTGLPITASAVVFPAFYLLKGVIEQPLYGYLFETLMLVTGILFITKIKVFKPGLKGAVFFLIVGLIAILRFTIKLY